MSASAYRYRLPPGTDGEAKVIVEIAHTGLLAAHVEVVRRGGETNMHAHNGEDAIWYVLGGRAAFYDDTGAKRILAKNDAIILPSGVKYWFESASDEPLEILRVSARDRRVERSRTDFTERKRRIGAVRRFPAELVDVATGD
jgi:mannose-6-phosphate isomerase-like protein (cupin superfamily)